MKKVSVFIVVLFGLVSIQFGFGSPAYAGTDDYPTKWKSAALDSVVDDWGYYNRECTSFVAWRLANRNGFAMPRAIGNASQWGYWASSHGYTVDKSPSVGSIAWWGPDNKSGIAGHVAWVESVNQTTVTVEQYNIPARSGSYTEKTYSTGSIDGFIHFKDIPTSTVTKWVGAVENGSFYVKQNDLYSAFTTQEVGVKAGVLGGNFIGALLSDGRFEVKDGSMYAPWDVVDSNVVAGFLTDHRIGALLSNGQFEVKEGGTKAPWIVVDDHVVTAAISGNRIAVIRSDGQLRVKEGSLDAPWHYMENGVSGVSLSPNRVGALLNDGRFEVKEGNLDSAWTVVDGQVTQGVVTDDYIGVLKANGALYAKAGGISTRWVGLEDNVVSFTMSGDRIGALLTNKNFEVKEGNLSGAWLTMRSNASMGALGQFKS